MVTSFFESCSDSCGWVAAVVAVLSFGSFGVPIKGASKVDVHPLVMQSYKTIVCFLTCWLVIFLGEPVRFSYYGILSGLFWVPGATCGIYGIRTAGLAVAVGTWSSLNVLSSFVFGIIVFQERVKDFGQTCFAFLLLVLGLIGMARYSSPQPVSDLRDGLTTASGRPIKQTPPQKSQQQKIIHRAGSSVDMPLALALTGLAPLEMEPLVDDEMTVMGGGVDDKIHRDRIFLCGRLSMTKHQTGVLGAVINGAWGGMNLIPLHFAMKRENLSGAGYLISYASGALIVNSAIWLLLIVHNLYNKNGSWDDALEALPKWHLAALWKAGFAAGLLYSIGNFATIIAVTYLGQGTGFSFCQMQLFVSGLWGVLYFGEIRGFGTIFKWFVSAAVAISGIIWLSFQHEGANFAHR